MKALDAPLFATAAFREANALLTEGRGPVRIAGAFDSQKVQLMMKAGASAARLIVTYDEQDAMRILEDVRFFTDDAYYFPAKDLLFYQADAKSNTLVRERIRVLKALRSGKPCTVVTTVQAMMNALPPAEAFSSRILKFQEGDTADLQELSKALLKMGYERTATVGEPGEFAVHGGILDVFDLTEESPVRIEFFGDEIDTIRAFHPVSQTSVKRLQSVEIYPATEFLVQDEAYDNGLGQIAYEYSKVLKILKDREDYEAAAALQAFYREAEDAFSGKGLPSVTEQFLPYFYDDPTYLEAFFPEETISILNEPVRVAEYADLAEKEFTESFQQRLLKGMTLPGLAKIFRPAELVFHEFEHGLTIAFTSLDQKVPNLRLAASFRVDTQQIVSYNGNSENLLTDLKRYQKLNFTVVLLVSSRTKGSRLAEEFRGYGLHAFYADRRSDPVVKPGEFLISNGFLRRGYLNPMQKFVLLTETDLFGPGERPKRKSKVAENGNRVRSFQELTPGDYVVHETYGIGIYRGVSTVESDGISRDYIQIVYADGASLYIPVTNLDVVQKYASAEAKPPKLNRLDSPEWKRTKGRVRAAVQEVADELVALYAKRQFAEGYEYGPDTLWQREFEEMFPYEETADQLQAIRDVKQDMESGKIMDRLIAGDVGFGKTEIAIRAAFKAVMEGKQVAYLVPTTILAEQHYHTFTERMQQYPVIVEMLSRFRTPKQQAATIENLKRGVTDIVIGTHKLLSKEVRFKDLGLLIIDEEQRFGVAHKEKIKELKTDVDVLTLSATPIPRTLNMAMIGIRDMSVLTEPPEERRSVQTYAMEYSAELVREAVQREISRNGQVYYVYNRANDIADVAASLQKLLPDASITYIHGRMNERDIEDRMLSFIEGSIDVLVSTTIIESGLDIPNVNMIIIHDAERYGLAQLYQLRGRVGRSNRQAYAFIMYRPNRNLSEVAEKRLAAIRQFTELGSGMKIAQRDMEIRGAGTLLGNAQSGHMALVGYELYCKMLSEAVKTAKGDKKVSEPFETLLDVPVDAYIPASYIEDEELKLEAYKRISYLRTEEDRRALEDELVDRYGDVPKPMTHLMEVALLRAAAHELYMTEVKGSGAELRFKFSKDAKLKGENLPGLIEQMKGALRFVTGETPALVYREPNAEKAAKQPVLPLLRTLLETIKRELLNS